MTRPYKGGIITCEMQGEQLAERDAVTMPRYVISVAARLVGVSPRTLRSYEAAGLVEPQRTEGNRRLYSDADIERVRRIIELTKQGVNLAGVKVILEMEEKMKSQQLKGGE